MEAALGLIGVVAGAVIALLGQWVQRHASDDQAARALLLEQCALIVSLENEIRHLIWDVRYRGQVDEIRSWPLAARRLAEARVLILSTDDRLRQALLDLRETGRQLGRNRAAPEESFRPLAEAHRRALWTFQDVAHRAVNGSGRRARRKRQPGSDLLRDRAVADLTGPTED